METLQQIRERIIQKTKPVIRLKRADTHPLKYFGNIISNADKMPKPAENEYSWYGEDRIRIHYNNTINIYVKIDEFKKIIPKPKPYSLFR